MGFSCGIVGLPNVGKSTLFNILTKSKAANSNYPFCTIDPNIGTIDVKDSRFHQIIQKIKPKSIVPAFMHFTDIAGLVKGANEGQGLGNKFLSHISNVQAILHLVRVFSDTDVIHIGEIDPIRDIEIILTELYLRDMELLSNTKKRVSKNSKIIHNDKLKQLEYIDKFLELLENNDFDVQSRYTEFEDELKLYISEINLISTKPMIIGINMDENDISNYSNNSYYQSLKQYLDQRNYSYVCLSVKLEYDLTNLDNQNEVYEYLQEYNISDTGLNKLVSLGYDKLKLIKFFTVGEKECKAWPIFDGITAVNAAAKIHSDIQRGFIVAEVISFNDFLECNFDYKIAKSKGKVRLEGKDYIVSDGDIINFKFNV